jgi:folate-binding protein YgfZ
LFWIAHDLYFDTPNFPLHGGPTIGAVAEAQTVEIDAEYRLLREEAGQLERPDRRILELRGAEGGELLEGQLTNEIESLAPGTGCYAALLDRKGKMRADMRVLILAEDLISVETDAATVDEVERHLQMYKIGREVELERRTDLAPLSLIGPRSSELLGGLPLGPEHSHRLAPIAGRELRVVATDHGADLIGPPEALRAASAELAAAGAEPVSREATEILRVEAGRPSFGVEMGNHTIPQEAGINERAVSFEKGCYIGQETVARLHHRGKPNRHLRRLVSTTPLQRGAVVQLGDKRLGEVGTAVISPARGPLALAILRREAEPGDEVSVGDSIAARVEEAEA